STFKASTSKHIYTLSLHDALPILPPRRARPPRPLISLSRFAPKQQMRVAGHFSPSPRLRGRGGKGVRGEVMLFLLVLLLAACSRSEEHTSELQSRENLV